MQATLLRVTIHIVSAADYLPFTEAVRSARRDWWTRAARRELEGVDVEAAAALVRERLAAGPARQAELAAARRRRVPQGGVERRRALGGHGPGPAVGHLGAAPADLYGLATDRLGPWAVGEADGLEHLVQGYLAGFGPASLGDLGSWAGLPLTTLRPVLSGSGPAGSATSRTGSCSTWTTRPCRRRAPRPRPASCPPGTRICWCTPGAPRSCPSATAAASSTSRPPHSYPTFLVDGAVAGTWRHEEGRVLLEPFESLGAAT